MLATDILEVPSVITAVSSGDAGRHNCRFTLSRKIGKRGYVSNADAQVERTMAYSATGQIGWIKDANNNRTDFTFDGHDRLVQQNLPVPTKGAHAASSSDYEHYTLDANGNRTGLRLRDGQPGSWTGPRFGYTGQMRLTNALPLWHY